MNDSNHQKPFLTRITVQPPNASLLEARAAENEAHAHAHASMMRYSGAGDGFHETYGPPTRAPPLIPRKPVPLRSSRHRADGSYSRISVAETQTIRQIEIPRLEEEEEVVEARAADAHAHADTLPGARDSMREILGAESAPARTPEDDDGNREDMAAAVVVPRGEERGRVHNKKTVRFPEDRRGGHDNEDPRGSGGLRDFVIPVYVRGTNREDSTSASDSGPHEAAACAPVVSRGVGVRVRADAGEKRSVLGSLFSAALAGVVGMLFLVLQGTWLFWFGMPMRVLLCVADRLGLPQVRRGVVGVVGGSWLPSVLLRRAERHSLEEEEEEDEVGCRAAGVHGEVGMLARAGQVFRDVEFSILKGLLLSALRVAEFLCDQMTARERAGRRGVGGWGLAAPEAVVSDQVERRFLSVHGLVGNVPAGVCGAAQPS